MANKHPERRALTRARIMDAFWQEYARDPVSTVTVSCVVERAGVHRSTFYEYFRDCADVLDAIEDELIAVMRAEAVAGMERLARVGAERAGLGWGTEGRGAAERTVAPHGAMGRSAVSPDDVAWAGPAGIVRRIYIDHGDRLSVLLGDHGDPRFARRVKDAIAPAVADALGVADDAFAPYMLEFVSSGILAAVALWYARGCDLPAEELGAGVGALIARGMA